MGKEIAMDIDDKQEPVVEWFQVFDVANNHGATVLICRSGNGYRYQVLPTADGSSGWSRGKSQTRKDALASVKESFGYRTNLRKIKNAIKAALDSML